MKNPIKNVVVSAERKANDKNYEQESDSEVSPHCLIAHRTSVS